MTRVAYDLKIGEPQALALAQSLRFENKKLESARSLAEERVLGDGSKKLKAAVGQQKKTAESKIKEASALLSLRQDKLKKEVFTKAGSLIGYAKGIFSEGERAEKEGNQADVLPKFREAYRTAEKVALLVKAESQYNIDVAPIVTTTISDSVKPASPSSSAVQVGGLSAPTAIPSKPRPSAGIGAVPAPTIGTSQEKPSAASSVRPSLTSGLESAGAAAKEKAENARKTAEAEIEKVRRMFLEKIKRDPAAVEKAESLFRSAEFIFAQGKVALDGGDFDDTYNLFTKSLNMALEAAKLLASPVSIFNQSSGVGGSAGVIKSVPISGNQNFYAPPSLSNKDLK